MTTRAFDTVIEENGAALQGPWRAPRQMLADQVYDDHASIHDDATAQRLGFRAATIEGPTHFSAFVPLCHRLWGDTFFETGSLSAHYRNAVFEGEETRAVLDRPDGDERQASIRMVKRDGTEVLRGTASLVGTATPTALERRMAEGLPPLRDPVILADATAGMKTRRQAVRMDFDQHMGELYPFSLRQKLAAITEPSPYYDPAAAAGSPWGRAIVPFEMLSVLFQHTARQDGFPVRGPAVGLFADQEIRLIEGPLFVGADYELEREVVALSGSRRTESLWVLTKVFKAGSDKQVAQMLLNLATLKESYAPYEDERRKLYGG
jgi:hypothetical protein